MLRFLLALCVLASGCAAPMYRSEVIRDDFDAHTIERMKWNALDGGGGLFPDPIAFDAQRFLTDDGEASYAIVVRYLGEDWLFIEGGESLVLLVDGERLAFSGDGSLQHREVVSGPLCEELAWYDTDFPTLQEIANAEEVRVKVDGADYFVERQFSEKNFSNLQRFLDDHPPTERPIP